VDQVVALLAPDLGRERGEVRMRRPLECFEAESIGIVVEPVTGEREGPLRVRSFAQDRVAILGVIAPQSEVIAVLTRDLSHQ
jgi:hypothetical protein